VAIEKDFWLEKDFRLASRRFWQTICSLRKGKQSIPQAVLSQRGVASISLAEAATVVKKFFVGKVPGVDEIRPEMLKALDIVGLYWLKCLFNLA